MPMQLAIDPEWTLLGGQVRIDGATLHDGQRKTTSVRLTDPHGAATERRAEVSTATGDFQLVIERLLVAGTWQVLATAPDGKGRATGTFRVLTWEQALEEVAGDWEDTVEGADRAVTRTAEVLAHLPLSPSRLAAEGRLAQLQRELATRNRDADTFRSTIGAVGDLVARHPDAAPLFAPLVENLGEWSRASHASRDQLDRQLAESEKRGALCESIHTASEGIKIATAWLNLAGAAVEIGRAFFRDYLADRLQSNLPEQLRANPTFLFAAGELVKVGQPAFGGLRQRYGDGTAPVSETAWAEGGAKLGGVMIGLCYDLLGLLVDQLFDRFCAKLEGPIDARLHVEFSNAEGTVWWRYDIHVEGRLKVRYAQAPQGQAIRVHGELVGSGTEFTLWEDVLQTLDPALMRGHVAFKKVLPAAGWPFVGAEGDYLGALGPRGFLVPVEGDLVDEKLTLSVLPAKTDFDGVNGWAYYVIFGVRTMGFPVFLEVPFPYKGAHFVITRAADAKDGPFTLPVRVDRRSQRVIAERTFERLRVRGDGNVADSTMKIKICSSGC